MKKLIHFPSLARKGGNFDLKNQKEGLGSKTHIT